LSTSTHAGLTKTRNFKTRASGQYRYPKPIFGAIPSLQNPQVQQQLNRMMQEALGGGFGTMQQDLGRTQQGLRELQQDLGPGPEADALDGYIKLFPTLWRRSRCRACRWQRCTSSDISGRRRAPPVRTLWRHGGGQLAKR
jgi:hypothetical protein